MKKRICLIILSLTAVFACALGLTACDGQTSDGGNNGGKGEHSSHVWSSDYVEDGDSHYQTCSGCNEKKYGDHDYGTGGVCVCGKEESDEGDVKNPAHIHTYNQKIAERKYLHNLATCEYKAEYYFSCECGEMGTETFEYGEPNEHTVIEDEAVAANCYRSGKTAGKYCLDCFTVFLEQTTIPKLEHQMGSGDVCELCNYHTPTDGLTYRINSDGQSCSVSGIGSAKDQTIIYIADEYQGKPVTGIADYAFNNCHQITDVEIPGSITSIGKMAFNECDGLTGITIPDSVTYIGSAPLWGCLGLTSITVSESNKNFKSESNCLLTKEGGVLISGCKNSVIPEGVTAIFNGAFAGQWEMTSIAIPDSVTSIGANAFSECSNLTEIVIPENVTFIDGSAFNNCRGLTSIVIPIKVTVIGNMAFFGCEGLTIYCEAEEKPEGWKDNWDAKDYSDCTVVWGYKG